MEYLKATELSFDPRLQISEMVVDAFYDLIKHFPSETIPKIIKALAASLVLEHFYVATEGEEVASIVAVKADKPPPINLERKILVKHLGLINGNIAYEMLDKYMVNHKYPFELSPLTGSIEIVATSSKYRGLGVAAGLVEHALAQFPHTEYVLEVIDTNKPAIRLYEKLGFCEITRKEAPNHSGFNYFLYMSRRSS